MTPVVSKEVDHLYVGPVVAAEYENSAEDFQSEAAKAILGLGEERGAGLKRKYSLLAATSVFREGRQKDDEHVTIYAPGGPPPYSTTQTAPPVSAPS